MGALPRPQVDAGPHRDLVEALHDLHHRAGWPSLRRLASEAGCSHTTVSHAFSSPRLPSWGLVEVLVEALGGDPDDFHDLWLAASAPTNGSVTAATAEPAARLAGRRTELAVVGHHLESGTGLLLVTGEAGIGKTALVSNAAASSGTFVATGHCRPLSSQVPLLPVGDLLRDVLLADAEWFALALDSCPAYVAPQLTPLLPELGEPPSAPAEPGFARQRLFTAVSAVLEGLASARPLALVVEDLPWADNATLDFLEVLVSRGVAIPIVATWRTDDPETPAKRVAWRARLARRTATLHLDLLTFDETAEQLAALDRGLSAADVERIYRRSMGQPLFTEQLAVAMDDSALPGMLQDVLVKSLSALDTGAWRLARVLAVADRPLTVQQLARATGSHEDPTPGLRVLSGQRLLADDRNVVRLRHPLVAEAIRHRLVPGEGTEIHRAVATLLAELPDPPASEIADHWRAAGEAERELTWRIRAARAADLRYARSEAHPQWTRVVELWSEPGARVEDRAVTLAKAHTRTIETAIGSRAEVATVRRLVDAAMAADLPEQGRAEVLLRAGDLECAYGDSDLGLRLIDQAVAINERHPPTADAGHVLAVRALIHGSLGHHEAVLADVERALAVAEAVDDADLRRHMLAVAAWARAAQGDNAEAVRLAAESRAATCAADDPPGAIFVAALETEVLLMTGARVDRLEVAAAEALAEADRWQIHNAFVDSTVANLATAHLREGDVVSAGALVDPRVGDLSLTELRSVQVVHCAVEACRGRLDRAITRLTELGTVGAYAAGSAERDLVLARSLLWAGRPGAALQALARAAGFMLSTDFAGESSTLLALHARAEADHAQGLGTRAARAAALGRVDELRGSAALDPLGEEALGTDLRANTLLWQAERARLGGHGTAETWLQAASEWDGLVRPHDAAYSRWRAAQVALREGQGTLTTSLLRKAARDARQHVPLGQAIAHTVAGAR